MNRHDPGQAHRGSPPQRSSPRIDHKSMTQYRDAHGLRREVFVDWPRNLAESLGRDATRTSLRRLYDQVAAMHFRIAMKPEDARKLLQEGMGKLRRFVQYQTGREVFGKGNFAVLDFIDAHYQAVGNDVEKFEGFYQLFQSVMAYLPKGR